MKLHVKPDKYKVPCNMDTLVESKIERFQRTVTHEYIGHLT